ncbi:MAG: hypothetical protein U0232_28830 [Thermomicrobiales bacterium]
MLDPGSTLIIEYTNGVRGILNGAKLTPTIYEIELLGPGGRYWLKDSAARPGAPTPPKGRQSRLRHRGPAVVSATSATT